MSLNTTHYHFHIHIYIKRYEHICNCIYATVAQSVYFKPQSLYTPSKLFTSPNSSKNDFITPNMKCKVPKLIEIESNRYISENINNLDIISSQSLGRQ